MEIEIQEIFDLIELLSIHNDNSIPVRLAETDSEFEMIFERELEKSKVNDRNIFAEIQIVEITERLKRAKDLQFYESEKELTGKAIEYKRFLDEILKNTGAKPLKPKFIQYLNPKKKTKEELLACLKASFPSGKNKEAAIMVFALAENELINIPKIEIDLIKAIMQEWKTDFGPENYRKPYREIEMNKKNGLKGEVIAAINKIKEFEC